MSGYAGKQSYISDKLTHFVGRAKPSDCERFDLLCEILRSGRLGTGHGNLTIEFPHSLASNKLLNPEMVCFCDIPFESMGIHMQNYSHFGLSFMKTFMKTKGCNPVYYISAGSPCTDHRYLPGDSRRDVEWGVFFQKAFDDWYRTLPCSNGQIDVPRLSPAQNMNLWYVFGHLKFFDSSLPEDDPKNYYMEREWRLIGSMEFQLSDVAQVILPANYRLRLLRQFPDFPPDRIREVQDTGR